MDLTERYLAAIRRDLPAGQADDIVAELADDLASRREEREETLGRELSEEELSRLLRDFGHPLVIAARYRADQYLIGPEIFPFYLFTLKVVLAVGGALLLGLGAVPLFVQESNLGRVLGQVAGDLWSMILLSVAVVTIVFAVLERRGFVASHVRQWRPEQLPAASEKRQSQWASAAEVGFGIAFLLWWSGAVTIPIVPGRGMRIEAAPVWNEVYWPVLVLASVQLGLNVMKWLRPRWRQAVGVLTVVTSVGTLAVIAAVQGAETWVTARPNGMDPARVADIGASLNLAIGIALVAVAAVMVVQVAAELWKLFRSQPQRAA